MWHITKREIYNNLNSLRFALTTVLLLALMVTNAVRHIREHPKRVQKYHDAVTASMNLLTSRADASLYTLAHEGPGTLYKNRRRSISAQPVEKPFYPIGLTPLMVAGDSGDWNIQMST